MTELIPCSKCGIEYPKSSYQKTKKMCKNCRNEYARRYKATNRKYKNYYKRKTEKVCPACGELKTIDHFSINENSKHKRPSKYCIECKAQRPHKPPQENKHLKMLLSYAAMYQANRGEIEA